MATKLDTNYVNAVRGFHVQTEEGFETMVREVQRLESLCEQYEAALTEIKTGGLGAHTCAILASNALAGMLKDR